MLLLLSSLFRCLFRRCRSRRRRCRLCGRWPNVQAVTSVSLFPTDNCTLRAPLAVVSVRQRQRQTLVVALLQLCACCRCCCRCSPSVATTTSCERAQNSTLLDESASCQCKATLATPGDPVATLVARSNHYHRRRHQHDHLLLQWLAHLMARSLTHEFLASHFRIHFSR